MPIEEVLAKIGAGGWTGSSALQVSGHDSTLGDRQSSFLGIPDTKSQVYQREIRASLYYCRAEKALQEICRNGYEAFGAITYLRKAYPERARHLDVDLWERIDHLWDEGAPVEVFQSALDQWVKAHAEACSLFSEAVRNGDDLALSIRTKFSQGDFEGSLTNGGTNEGNSEDREERGQ